MSASVRADERAMKLMAYADGELEGAELAEVEKWLGEDAEAVLFANDLAELGDLVKVGSSARDLARDFDIADAVMKNIEEAVAPKTGASEVGKVIPFEPRRTAPVKKRNAVGLVVAGLALAASVFFVARAKHDDETPLARTTSPLVQPVVQPPASAAATPAPAAMAAAANPGSVDVENPGRSVSVFYLPDEKSMGSPSVTTVVWVDESGGK